MIAIILDKGENPAALRRIISAINRPDARQISIIEHKEKVTEYKSVVLVGAKIIGKYLGAGVVGRNAAMQIEGVWYFTLPDVNRLHSGDSAIRAANQIVRALDSVLNPNFAIDSVPYAILSRVGQLRQLADECLKSTYLAFDFETNNKVQTRDPEFLCTMLGICIVPNFTWCLPNWMLYDKECLAILQEIFSDSKLTKIAHNLAFDIKCLLRLGITPKGRYGCTKILCQLYNENFGNGLKEAVDIFLPQFSGYDYKVDYSGDVTPLYRYLAIDCHATLYLYCMFVQHMCEDQKLYVAYRNLYMPSCMVLKDLEWEGCEVSKKHLDTMAEKVQGYITERLQEIQEMPEVIGFVVNKNVGMVRAAIQDFKDKIAERTPKVKAPDTDKHIGNWKEKIRQYQNGELFCVDTCDVNSPKVLAELLYTELGFNLPNPMRDGASSNSTDKEALDDIDHPIGVKIRSIRTMEKMVSTFYKGISEKIIDGKIYAGFNQTGTSTGRLSSNSPNMQNIPTRVSIDDDQVKDCVKGVKKGFIAPEGYVVMQADLSQAELRVIAHLSKDENMIDAYRKNLDLHAITGSRIAGMQDDFEGFLASPIYRENRVTAKSANFGLVYKISPDGYINYIKLMTGKKITPAVEKLHRASVFGAYPRLLEWHKEYEDYVRAHGNVRTLFGVKRHLPKINSRDRGDVAEALRLAINSPVQGTIGGYAQWVMVWLKMRLDPRVRMWSTVHDSILFYVPTELIDTTAEIIFESSTTMPISPFFDSEDFSVPLKMDIEIGPNYGELSEYKIN